MKKSQKHNLISDTCNKIASGYDFGGWTDKFLSDGVLGPFEYRASNEAKKRKFKLIQQQEKERDSFLATSGRKKLNAKIKDNKARKNTFRNR